MPRIPLQPYGPGQARGVLRRGAADDGILLLSQAELAGLRRPPRGCIVVGGAPFSHTLIRLLGQGVPVLLADAAQAAALPIGQAVFIDGERGLLVSPPDVAPDAETPSAVVGPVLTADGVAVDLRCSVGNADAARRAREAGAGALGSVRTEFFYPADGSPPDADFYEAAFAELFEAASPLPVTLRLIDIAADKRPPWLAPELGPGGPLGLQGARLYESGPVRRAFEAQLEALARLSARHEFSLLIPYLTSVAEFVHWRDLVRGRLPSRIRIGAMVETPALALALPELLAEADFVAFGMNDMMQCLFAADRYHGALAAWLDPHAPALYRFLRAVADAAGEGGGVGANMGAVQVCGLLPQLPGVLPLLLGLGLRSFSVEPVMIPYLAARARTTDTAAARELLRRVLAAPGPEAVRALLRPPA